MTIAPEPEQLTGHRVTVFEDIPGGPFVNIGMSLGTNRNETTAFNLTVYTPLLMDYGYTDVNNFPDGSFTRYPTTLCLTAKAGLEFTL
jgi:hypothetical protein